MSSIAVQDIEIDDIIFPKALEKSKGQTYQIDSQEKASWAARRIIQSQKAIDERILLSKLFKERIADWLEQANKADEERIENLSMLLLPYLEHELAEKKNGKSLKVFGATIGLRKQPEKISVIDEDKALAFCKEKYPDAVIVKTDLSKTELKKIANHGIFVPGVLLAGGGEKLYVKES